MPNDITLNLFGRDVNLSRTLRKAGDEADKTAVKLSALGRIGIVTGLAAALPAALNVVSAALTATAAAALLVPGALLVAGAAFGTAALGVQYFGKALKDVRDPKKFAADLRGLSPAAQEAARAIRSLLPAFDNLRLNVQENLFRGAAQGIRQLSGQYLPVLRKRLTSISAVLNQAAGGLGRFLGRPEQVKLVDQILASTAQTVGVLGQALQPVARAFLQLAAVGSQFLPSFATLLGVAATKFAAFVDAGVKTGQITAFIRTGVQLMGLFASALDGARQIIGGILSAAAKTPDGLSSVAGLLKSIGDQINTPAFQGGLSAVFIALNSAATSIASVLPQVAAALVAISPAIASVIQGLGAGFAAALAAAAQLIISLAPQINALAAGFASIAPSLGPAILAIWGITKVIGPLTSVISLGFRAYEALRSLAIGLRIAATAFRFLALALAVDPVILIIAAIALLVIGLVVAYQHSETFRTIVQAAFRAVATVVLQVVKLWLLAWQKMFEAASHLPGIGHAMEGVAAKFAEARQFIDGVSRSINTIPTHVGVAVDVAYNVSVSGPAGILGAGKYGGFGQGLGVLAPQGGNKTITLGRKTTSAPKVSYNSGLGVGKGFGEGVGKGVGTGIKKTADYSKNALVKNAKALAVKLKSAMDKLTAIVKARAAYIKQIRDALIAATAITGFEKDPNRRGTPGADYYIKYLAGRLKALRTYTTNVAKLRKAGLNRTTLQQILDAGVDGGSDDAAALAAGGKKAVAQVNKLQGQIGKTAGSLATGVGNQFYKTGVEAARGLVRGLQSSRKALLAVARSLAKGLRDAIRKELKIKSPSRALHEDGRYAGLGFLGGVNSTRAAINKSLTGLSRPTGGFTGARTAAPVEVHHHYELHAGVVVDSTNVIRTLDGMAKTAKTRYRPHTLALQGR